MGSKTEVAPLERQVRSTLKSRLRQATPACLRRANNGLMQRSKQHRYSITSSARTNGIGGTVGLSALLRSGWERTDRRLSPSSFFAK